MKTVLKWLGLALVALIGVVVVGGLLLPTEFEVSRSRTIPAGADALHAQVADLEQYEQWQPWAEDDPTMTRTWGERRSGQGASYSWSSEQHGSGTLSISESVPGERVVFDLDFGGSGAVATLSFEEQAEGTEVTWHMRGDMDLPVVGGWMALMMDPMVGETYDRGLANLERRVLSN